MLDKGKSKMIQKGLNMFLNGKYGTVESFNLETKSKQLQMTLLLNGETETVDVEVGRYKIDDSNPDKLKISLHEIKASRQWMQELAHDRAEGKTIDVPQKLSSVVRMVL